VTDVTLAPGELFEWDLTIFNDATDATPRDLTGAHVAFEVFASPAGVVIAHGTATIATDPTTGDVALVLDTHALTSTTVYWYVVTLHEADGTTTNVLTGRLAVTGIVAA
jgi:hypothetical protein